MFARVAWGALALSCATTVAAQDTTYQFTMSVTSPAPIPGKPFTLMWTGGQPTEAVYIVLNGYFPDTPNQNIIYTTTDILSNAPNNGSWTYNVPLNIDAGRHSFSIGYNPLMLSDTTDIFTILPSQTSSVAPAPAPSTTNTAFQTYNGCGLPPLPDYTYTGYQPRTVTSNGRVETLYPIVPASDSPSFYGSSASVAPTASQPTRSPSSTTISSSSTSLNTAFATGVFAQALQCPIPVTPSTTKITSSGATTIFSLVGCTASASIPSISGVCHTSGYTTFSVSGTSSVCCPNGWATTPLNAELFCFTEMDQALKKRQVSTETLAQAPYTEVEILGIAFTTAGVVEGGKAVETGSSTASGKTSSALTSTGSTAGTSTTKAVVGN